MDSEECQTMLNRETLQLIAEEFECFEFDKEKKRLIMKKK